MNADGAADLAAAPEPSNAEPSPDTYVETWARVRELGVDEVVRLEEIRVAEVARRRKVQIPTAVEAPLAETPPICRPAARLFTGLGMALRARGVDPLPMLADSRYDAVTKALEALLPAFDRGVVELEAVRGLEPFLLDMIEEVDKAAREAALLAPLDNRGGRDARRR